MIRFTLILSLVAVLGACGNKETAPAPRSTPALAAPKSAESPKPSTPPPSCTPGQVMADSGCVPILAPEQQRAVAAEAENLGVMDSYFERMTELEAILTLVDFFMKSEAWQIAAKTSASLSEASKTVGVLRKSLRELQGLRSAIRSTRAFTEHVLKLANTTAVGKETIQTLKELRTSLANEIKDLGQSLGTLSRKNLDAAITSIEPALNEIAKWKEAVCAIAVLADNETLKKHCKTIDERTDDVMDMLANISKVPERLLSKTFKVLDTTLSILIADTPLEALLAPAKP